ncbi:MAG: hypothetical protein IIB61_06935 [Planctomycetes bacterium]|nr:hypothetical protein [Planctomycetota bacterium]
MDQADRRGVTVDVGRESRPKRARRGWAIPIALVSASLLAAVYAAYQRIGTIANVDLLEYTANKAGGFLAVGMTTDEPGIVVFSAMDNGKVDVNADRFMNQLAGTYTVVTVETGRAQWRKRLRGPLVVMIDGHGTISAYPVQWTIVDFDLIKRALKCGEFSGPSRRPCGFPFVDLHDELEKWSLAWVPDPVRKFLATYGRRR